MRAATKTSDYVYGCEGVPVMRGVYKRDFE